MYTSNKITALHEKREASNALYDFANYYRDGKTSVWIPLEVKMRFLINSASNTKFSIHFKVNTHFISVRFYYKSYRSGDS
jgi:hypothetical protein